MDTQGPNPKLIDALSQASSLELFQLGTIIERMLADPRRIIAVRSRMHLGQTVRFLDWHDGRMRSGKVVAMRDHQVTLHETDARREWKLPYAAVEPPPGGGQPTTTTTTPPTAAALSQPGREDFRCGEKVSFEDRYMQTQIGTIVRINQRTATVETADGPGWRVPFRLLRHVVDI